MLDRLKNSRPDIQVGSAGLGALVGHAADNHVIDILDGQGIDARAHRARQLTVDLINSYELILALEKGHIRVIHDMAPQSIGRVHLLGKWNNNEEISDPYRKSRGYFDMVFASVDQGVKAWEKYL